MTNVAATIRQPIQRPGPAIFSQRLSVVEATNAIRLQLASIQTS
jgi:hypothetical protein